MTRLIETLISGLSLGSIYALMALGYTMVYGIAKMLNFAHGDIIMVGAYAVVTSVLTLGMPPLVAILISIAICALLGITVEFLAYRPLRQAPPLAVLITAIGVSYLLQNLALLIYGSEQKAFPVLFTIPSVELGGVYIDGITIATMAVTAIIMVGLSLFINRTRMGKAMRAVSEDKEAAELMGISVNRTSTERPTPTSGPPPAPCPASRPLPQPCLAASGLFPALCWAVCCWALSSSSPRRIFPPCGPTPSCSACSSSYCLSALRAYWASRRERKCRWAQ